MIRLILMLFLPLICAVGILFYPLAVVGAAIILIFLLIPLRTLMIGLAVFLPFQNLIAYQFQKTMSISPFFVNWVDEAVILFGFLMIAGKSFLGTGKWKKSFIDIPLLILIVMAVLSTIANQIVSLNLAGSDLFLLLKGFMLFLIFRFLELKEEELKKIFRIFLGITGIIIFLGFIDLAVPFQFRGFIGNVIDVEYRFSIPSVVSIFIQPGIYGWFMAFICCFSFAYYMILENKTFLYFSLVCALNSVFSMRFKPISGIAVALLASLFFSSRNKKSRYALSSCLILLVGVVLFGDKILLLAKDKLYVYMQASSSRSVARNVLYTTSVQIARDYFPLGSGLATFGGFIAAENYSPLYREYGCDRVWGLGRGQNFLTDTFWPYVLGQFGFLGLGCYLWIIFLFIKGLIRIIKTELSPFNKAFVMGTLMILIEGLVESMAEPVFLKPPQYFFIFSVIGISFSFSADKKIT